MKILTTTLLLAFSIQAHAGQKIIDYKDWTASIIDSHAVSEKEACVAKTSLRSKDTHLEVYAEVSRNGYVEPVVQIVTTNVPPALGVVASIDGTPVPMTISLIETKEVQQGLQTVEQQVFLGKFKDKEQVIRLLRAKNRVRAKFYSESGMVADETFSLRGSSRTIKTMMSTCF